MQTEIDKLQEEAERGGSSTRPQPEQQEFLMNRYTMPKWAKCCKSFVMRELAAPDQLEARILADQRRQHISGDNVYGLMTIEQFETMRLAFVEVDGTRVNTGGLPYQGLDTWKLKELRLAMRAYEELNGVEDTDLENFTRSAQVVTSADLGQSGRANGSDPATAT